MKIVTYQRRTRSKRAGLLIEGNRVLDIGRAYTKIHGSSSPGNSSDTASLIDTLRGISASVIELLHIGDEAITHLFELERLANKGDLEECLFSIGETPLVAPIPEPPLILHFDSYEAGALARFKDLNQNANGSLPEIWYQFPNYYFGNPYAICGTGSSVVFPEGETRCDFELEIGAVLGEPVHDASIEDAEDAILGYTIVNDWCGRDGAQGLQELATGSSRAASFATSIGPYIVTKEEVTAISSMPITVKINSKVVAEGNTGGANFSFAEMISFASEGVTLPPGTIITSGAVNKGSGIQLENFLKPGDLIDLSVEGLGTLTNRVYEKQRARIFQPKARPAV